MQASKGTPALCASPKVVMRSEGKRKYKTVDRGVEGLGARAKDNAVNTEKVADVSDENR